jgi:PAS domain S-box-containing protein
MDKRREPKSGVPEIMPRARNGTKTNDVQGRELVFPYPSSELEAAIQRYIDLFDYAPIGYVTFDRIGRIEEVNIAATRLLDRRRVHLVGKPFAACVSNQDRDRFQDHLRRCRSPSLRIETELNLKQPDGNLVPVELSSIPTLAGMKDGVRLYQTAIIDLRERKAAEEAMRAKQAELDLIVKRTPFMLTRCSHDLRYRYVSQAYAKMVGFTPAEIAGKPIGEIMGARGLAGIRPYIEAVLSGKTVSYEEAVHFRRGGRRFLRANYVPDKDERGRIVGWIASLVDITKRKKAEEELRQSEELYRALVSQTAVGMSRTNRLGRFIFVNEKFCEMLGYEQSEILGKRIVDITHHDDIAESKRLFRQTIEKGESYNFEKRYLRKDGSAIWVNVAASPMRDEKGRPQSAVSVIRDITDRKQAYAMLESRVEERTRELVTANEELQNQIALRHRLEGEILEISDREQRRLGQDLHDSLCQHLTATAYMAQVMARRLQEHRVVEVKDLEKIATLINDGVTEARTIARGLHPVEMDSAGLTTALRSLLHRQSKLPYRLDIDEDISVSDPTVALHLYRIAREAVINANKHAHARELFVRMGKSRNQIELSVTDDGAGLGKQTSDAGGMGFHIMNYRARSIGARLEITTIKPHGTRVACYLPHE